MDISKDIERAFKTKHGTHEILINGGVRRGLLNSEPGSIDAPRRTVFTVSYVFLTHTDDEARTYLIDDEAVIKGRVYTIKNVLHDEWGMTKLWFGAQRSQGEIKTQEEGDHEFGI